MTDTREYRVQGMTCSHCVAAVRDEVGGVQGVDAVEVDLDSGRVTVRGTEFSDDAVREAVDEAGYELVS